MSTSKNNFKIYINIYLHYPEVVNSTIINDKINVFFNEYFSNNKLIDSSFDGNTYVMINSAPHNENQNIEIDVVFSNEIDESLRSGKFESDVKEFLSVYFNKQIKEIYVNFTK